MTPRTVSIAWLREHDACPEQVRAFAKVFGRGEVHVTAARIRKAARLGLNLGWYARRALDAPAKKAYDEAGATAWKAYDEACAPAWKAYNEARAPALISALGLPERGRP